MRALAQRVACRGTEDDIRQLSKEEILDHEIAEEWLRETDEPDLRDLDATKPRCQGEARPGSADPLASSAVGCPDQPRRQRRSRAPQVLA